jgi:hypothetical protein
MVTLALSSVLKIKRIKERVKGKGYSLMGLEFSPWAPCASRRSRDRPPTRVHAPRPWVSNPASPQPLIYSHSGWSSDCLWGAYIGSLGLGWCWSCPLAFPHFLLALLDRDLRNFVLCCALGLPYCSLPRHCWTCWESAPGKKKTDVWVRFARYASNGE